MGGGGGNAHTGAVLLPPSGLRNAEEPLGLNSLPLTEPVGWWGWGGALALQLAVNLSTESLSSEMLQIVEMVKTGRGGAGAF